jgi:pyruvate/2-oxoglutarate dehydrogenase complex dihydrolipoamide acyltransferase (E2) component
MANIEFKLPDIGEGVAEGEITSWKVKAGDALTEDQIMVEVMTDKATVEIGSPVTGHVVEIRAAEGATVPVGSVIVVLAEGAAKGKSAGKSAPSLKAEATQAEAREGKAQPAGKQAGKQAASARASDADEPSQPAAKPAAKAGAKPSEKPAMKPAAKPAAKPAPAKAEGGGELEEVNFALPDIGEGVAEGEVTKWLVEPGERVHEDQPIVEVMTDKATVEIGSPVDGEVLQLLVAEGQTVPVGEILLVLGASRGAGAAPASGSGAAPTRAAAEDDDEEADDDAADQEDAADEDDAADQDDDGGDDGLGPEADEAPTAPRRELVGAGAPADTGLPARGDGSRRVRAAPATRRYARELGVEVGQVAGTGPNGRVTMEDVRAASADTRERRGAAPVRPAAPRAPARAPAPAAPAPAKAPAAARAPAATPARTAAPAPAPAAAPAAAAAAAPAPVPAPKVHELAGDRREPLRGLRKRIAAQMRVAKQTAAHFTYVEEIDASDLVRLRNSAKGRAEAQGVKLTYMPFLIKATVAALKEFPLLNASLDEQAAEIVFHGEYNIGIAVDTPNGLIVPVVRHADCKSMLDLAREMGELAERARNGKTRPEDVGGGTFTITNAGNIGGMLATPIINVPEVAIMGVHAIRKRPWVVDDEIVIREIMLLSLSLDHRVVDGAVGAYFMNRVKQLIENPGLMLFEEP